MTKLSPEKIEIATLTRADNKTNIQILAAPKVPPRTYPVVAIPVTVPVVSKGGGGELSHQDLKNCPGRTLAFFFICGRVPTAGLHIIQIRIY